MTSSCRTEGATVSIWLGRCGLVSGVCGCRHEPSSFVCSRARFPGDLDRRMLAREKLPIEAAQSYRQKIYVKTHASAARTQKVRGVA